ncbi:potassium-transporting ATPase subunit KdpC [Glaciibacter psychrotolerans]|uniref:Potassium-transporting ATPase KdpC subunit n=1 Tax=Glaciibacter psychrotolerans TaxID=670054 RepID=A0A7Z0J5B8_9MICO|nr:potassium-transporting ATPase subunit KdpC [Leifsonia psychrotolerans]NYJ18936.1 K+-transporting ATPase ATPase C chain [Leifsonia psychrotolerans]
MSSTRTTARNFWVALRAMVVLTVALGVIYPLAITVIGQTALPWQANGSRLGATGTTANSTDATGTTVGSALIGQSFSDAAGVPLPEWFQPRPSAAGDGYDASASSGSNWGPENPDLIAAIAQRKSQITAADGVTERSIPADALTASSSGLDPHISPENARMQVDRVAAARGLSPRRVEALVESKIQGRDFGVLGDPIVNVLQLNIALQEMDQ